MTTNDDANEKKWIDPVGEKVVLGQALYKTLQIEQGEK